MNLQVALQTVQLANNTVDIAIKTSTCVAFAGIAGSAINVALGTGCYALGGMFYLGKAVFGSEQEKKYEHAKISISHKKKDGENPVPVKD